MKNYYFVIISFLALNVSYSQGKPLFEKISSKKSNIVFSNEINETQKENIFIYDNLYAGAGVGLGDINNDGLLDVYFCGNQVSDKLYLNKGDFVFEDITKSSGIKSTDIGWSSSVSMVDYNNDGYLDIFVTKELHDDKPEWRRNKLYLNRGDGKFSEVAQQVGLGDTLRTRAVAFFDFDKDDDLDVFLLHQPPNPGKYSKYIEQSLDGSLLDEQYAPRLYENRNNIFFDITKEANLLESGFSNAVSIADLNNDGFPDIVVANDFEAPDRLYINKKNGTFENIANKAFNHTSFYSMGIDIADINNDQFLDIYVVDMVAEDNFRLKANMSGMNPDKFWKIVDKKWNYQYMYNTFQLNNGNDSFSDIAMLSGISRTDWSWSPLIADFDNDGLKDFFVTNGLLRDIRNTDADKNIKLVIHEKIQAYLKIHGNVDGVDIWDIIDQSELTKIYPSNKLQNKLYNNKGSYKFNDVSTQWGLKDKSFSNGSAYGDLDNDGDLDLVVNNINDLAFIYKNNSQNNYLRLDLKSKENKPLFGSRVTIKVDNEIQVIETTNVRGIYSTSEQVAHFGLGSSQNVDELTVVWPNGFKTILKDIKANQKIDLYMEDGIGIEYQEENRTKSFLVDITSENKLVYKHIENNFDDYEYQVLLPHKMSQFGPSLAVDDVNNDGLKDVFVGGAVGSPGKLYLQSANGDFKNSPVPAFVKDKFYEDVDALFFDIDNDGDKDLYAISGGNEFESGSDYYKDRLYINDGKGNFLKDVNSLKTSNSSGSVVVPVDFDNDGDTDLFVGGRLTPRQYPLPADSQLLENKNGVLVDVTKTKAIELMNLGLVTDAKWIDYDNDNDLDLIVVGEWMPITIFKNEDNNFVKEEITSLLNTEGWWFSIEQGDFDNDGDMDFVAGNLGLNYKYNASPKTPFDVYYEDFDGNGKSDIVLGYYNYGKHYPLRGFSCSAQQIPELKEKIKKYDVFASLEIQDIFEEKKLNKALYYKAQTFASSFIENLGNGQFKVTELPIEAQFSNVNDILIDDFNIDGNLDILLVGNLFVSEVETPRNDAGIGLVLLGDGKNKFQPLHHLKSGFFARKDAKKVKILNDKNQKLILVANNDDWLQIFKVGN